MEREYTKQIMEYLDCPYELVEPENALQRFNQLKEEQESVPVVIVATEDLAFHISEQYSASDDIANQRQEWLEQSKQLDGKALLDEWFCEEDMEEEDFDGDTQPEPDISLPIPLFRDYQVLIAQIPTDDPAEVPIFLPMGGFNLCPTPPEQAAIFRYWHATYGAVPYAVSFDSWVLLASNQQMDREQARMLAREHFAFCEELYTMGEIGPAEYAAMIRNAQAWYFWWD